MQKRKLNFHPATFNPPTKKFNIYQNTVNCFSIQSPYQSSHGKFNHLIQKQRTCDIMVATQSQLPWAMFDVANASIELNYCRKPS